MTDRTPRTEELEARLLACTAPLHPQPGSEELLLRLFREQNSCLQGQRRVRAISRAALPVAACLVFCAVFGLVQQAPFSLCPLAAPPLPPALPQLPPAEEPAPHEPDDIESGIPEGTIDDIMKTALTHAH